jgi:hypothetical protein
MPIPSLSSWKKTTITASLGGRSPAMGLIDDKIREFWAAGGVAGPQNTAAYGIRKACRNFSANPSRNPVVNAAVRNLEAQAEAELAANLPGWSQFAAAKAQGRGGQLKALAPGYAHERRQYVAEGKASNPVSASALRDVALADAPVGTNPHHLITQMDDATWDGYAQPGGVMRRMGAQNEVLFFDKKERLEHMLVVNSAGRLTWARNGQLFGTPVGSPYMYAMDGYGNLFAKPDNLGATQFNHSSFNAGREVVCAGMIGGAGGFVHFISNESGHYQPDRGALYTCVRKLRQAGLQTIFPRVQAGAWQPANAALARIRVRALGIGDWPSDTIGNILGYEHIAAAMGNPPAPIPNPPTYFPWQ